MLTKELIIERLRTIKYPGFSRDIVSFGMIKEIEIQNSTVSVTLSITTQNQQIKDQIITLVQEQLQTLEHVKTVNLETVTPEVRHQRVPQTPADKKPNKLLTDVKYKIAVASGKGGVGKSTVAVNLALALAQRGAKVGLLDADIYGPNIPMMMGVKEQPKGQDGKVLPVEKYGIKLMSIGFFLDEKAPIIWRGPLVGKAIEQLMRDVAWTDLDFFMIDMPPGTGDAQISLSNLIELSGSVMIATPQDVALADVVKGVKMFQKVDVEILGLVENMSYFFCPHCHERTEIFSHGTTKKACADLNVPFLGEIPLDTTIRIGGDEGKPIVAVQPDSAQSKAFFNVADQILQRMPLGKKE